MERYKDEWPEEFSGKFEGDILLDDSNTFRNHLFNARKWTNNTVVYDASRMPPWAQKKIRKVLNNLEMKVGNGCVRFVERTGNERNYVRVISGTGCYSYVGMTGAYGGQVLSLNLATCLREATIQHEFLHVLGFAHEHNRADRDQYIKINWNNIKPSQRLSFQIQNIHNLMSNYTYGSLMQYGRYAFSANGGMTMEPLKQGAKLGGRRLHQVDILRIRTLYKCPGGIVNPDCVDRVSNCAAWTNRCNDWTVAYYMKTNCKKTCDFC
ncbi:hatching enzyme 1.2-like [Tubulanus polymorphus]|uniref:hatching enzyme 1.2-like n=1 Tax=Tubulanus polymorphus TaxID=672921 RepID=UPI003DA316A5